jgi:hypothetical protein
VDYVVVGLGFGGGGLADKGNSVAENGGMGRREIEIFCGEFVDDGVDFEDCGVDAVVDEGGG